MLLLNSTDRKADFTESQRLSKLAASLDEKDFTVAQGLFLAQCSEMTPGSIQETTVVPEIQTKVAVTVPTCKVSAFLTVLSL